MPSKTEAQARLMRAVAHGWKKPGGGGPSVDVAKEFVAADKGKKKFGSGGTKAKINKQDTRHGKLDMPFSSLNKYAGKAAGGTVKDSPAMERRHAAWMKAHGAPSKMVKEEENEMAKGGGVESKGKTKGKLVKMAKGGAVRGHGCETKGKTKGKIC